MSVVIVDIDGTISKVGDRLRHLQETPKDWDSFYNRCDEDVPISAVIDLVLMLSQRHQIIFCTGRRESCREKTREWIRKYMGVPFTYCDLLMRKDGDYRHDTEIKPEAYLSYHDDFRDVFLVLEDRSSMVKRWRELGVLCLQVADGDF